MLEVIGIVRSVHSYGVKRILRITKVFLGTDVAPGYRVNQWMNDEQVDRDDRLFFKTIASKAPYLEEILQSEADERGAVFDFRFEGTPALGLGVAYILDTAAVSLLGCSRFAMDPVSISVMELRSDDSLEEKSADVCCLSSVNQSKEREAWFSERVAKETRVNTGVDLWERRADLWPNLQFCPSTEKQLKAFSGNEGSFGQILRHLEALNSAVSNWQEGPFSLSGVRWSYESEPTMNNNEFAAKRTFECPDGNLRVFSPHTKLIGANLRIHFLPDKATKSAYVGYVGEHLPTMTKY